MPKFVNGQTTVWSSGEWTKKGSFQKKITELVDYLYKECQKAKEIAKQREQDEKERRKQAKADKVKKLSEAWS